MADTVAPDFSHLALVHLQVRADEFRQHVQAYVETATLDNLKLLIDDIQRFRNTLVLLDKCAAVFVAEELLELLNACVNNQIDDRDELAAVLVLAGDKLGDHVASLQRNASLDNALPLLPLLNDSRACRGEPLLSASVVLAAGIDLSSALDKSASAVAAVSVNATREMSEWYAQLSRARSQTLQHLLAWFQREEQRPNIFLAEQFLHLADFSAARVTLAELQPLFQSASVLITAIRANELPDSIALRRVFAQLERWMYQRDDNSGQDQAGKQDHDQSRKPVKAITLPAELFRNCLYYVAQTQNTSRHAMELRRRYRLDRIRHSEQLSLSQAPATIGMAYHVSRGIRSSIDAETHDLREWLNQSPTSANHPHVQRLLLRLKQLDPVLTLLGSQAALLGLRHIIGTLDSLEGNEVVDAATRLNLAELLLRLDRTLDELGRSSLYPGGHGISCSGADSRTVAASTPGHQTPDHQEVYIDLATDACLTEARRALQLVVDQIEHAIDNGGLGEHRRLPVLQRLAVIDHALQIIPLPEMQPLFAGLREVVNRFDKPLGDAARESLATLMVSLDYYLGCVLQPQPAAAQLLIDAEDALAVVLSDVSSDNATQETLEGATETHSAVDATVERKIAMASAEVAAANDDVFMAAVLTQMSDIAQHLQLLRGQLIDDQSLPADAAKNSSMIQVMASLEQDFVRLQQVAEESDAPEVARLATRSAGLLNERQSSVALSLGDVELLEEVHAVLPQVLARRQGGSDEVRGLETLLQELDAAGPLIDMSANADDASAMTLDVDGDVLPFDGTQDGTQDVSRDGTRDSTPEVSHAVPHDGAHDVSGDRAVGAEPDTMLQQVFQRECELHLQVLSAAVQQALVIDDSGHADLTDSTAHYLPTEQMLRALHTLTGSAQTVGADAIVSLVLPLQRVALARHRTGDHFDASETVDIGELVDELQSRLTLIVEGGDLPEDEIAIEQFMLLMSDHADDKDLDNDFDSLAAELSAEAEHKPAVTAAAGAGSDSRTSANTGTNTGTNADTNTGIGADTNTNTGTGTGTGTGTASKSAMGAKSGAADSREAMLDRVFDDEARQLLSRIQGGIDSQAPDIALGALHTLKGSARMVGRHALADAAHALEGSVQSSGNLQQQINLLTDGRVELAARLLQTETVVQANPGVSIAENSIAENSAASVAADDKTALPALTDSTFDGLLNLATDVAVSQARLREDLSRLNDLTRDLELSAARWQRAMRENPASEAASQAGSAQQEMLADIDAVAVSLGDALRLAESEQQHASRASAALQQTLVRSRLVRVDEVRDRLSQAIEDTRAIVTSTDGQTPATVVLHIDGGELTLDRTLFRQLLGPLEHLVRNAVAHGIEAATDRQKLGKKGRAQVLLSASIDGTDLVLRVSDDGRGIDTDVINIQRQARGQSRLQTQSDLQDLLFSSGFSTRNTVDRVAGRGLGLTAVRHLVDELGGRVQLVSNPGEGTLVTLRVPQRIVVNQVVLVQSRGALFAVPVNFIQSVQGDNTDDAVSLARLLGQASSGTRAVVGALHTASAPKPSIVTRIGDHDVTLQVDAVLGYRELITQPLGPQMAALQRFSGGSVLADGRQVLILDLNRLLNTDRPASPGIRQLRDSLRPVGLIVDDSPTMRAAAGKMLQECGIATRFARDGLEALESIALGAPDFMIVDIDMPRLDGFGLIERLNSELGDQRPPIIVISSRQSAADKHRMQSLGVARFLAKPYRDTQLLEAMGAVGLRVPDLTIA